jgi:predicted transcriptional regulator
METIPLKPERQAQLEEYAQRRGQDPATALDDLLATYLEWERQDFDEAVEGVGKGHEDVKAGRTRPASEFLSDMRQKYGLPR